MDISEYEEMKKYAALLEASKEKEAQLQQEIKDLLDKQVKELEESKDKIVVTQKKEVREYKMLNKHPHEIYRSLCTLMERINGRFRAHPSDVEHYINNLQDVFFTTSSMTMNEDKSTKLVGLDEVRDAIAAEVRKEIMGEHEQLKSRNAYLEKRHEENKEKLAKVAILEQTNNDLHSDLETVTTRKNTLKKAIDEANKLAIIGRDGSFLARKEILNRIFNVTAI